MRRLLLCLAISACAFGNAIAQNFGSPTDEQISEAVEASKKRRGAISFWRSDALGLVFSYDERWQTASPSQKSTVSVINWISRESDDLMATCYLEVAKSEIGSMIPDEVLQRAEAITDAIMRNGRLRDPSMLLVKWQPAIQDNYPVVYIERESTLVTINYTYRMRIYSVVTSWRGREVNLECGSSVPIYFPKASGIVEYPIKKVLGSLQFVREPK